MGGEFRWNLTWTSSNCKHELHTRGDREYAAPRNRLSPIASPLGRPRVFCGPDVCPAPTPTSTRSGPSSPGSTSPPIRTCAAVGIFSAANRPRTPSGNVRANPPKRCEFSAGVFLLGVSVVSLRRESGSRFDDRTVRCRSPHYVGLLVFDPIIFLQAIRHDLCGRCFQKLSWSISELTDRHIMTFHTTTR